MEDKDIFNLFRHIFKILFLILANKNQKNLGIYK